MTYYSITNGKYGIASIDKKTGEWRYIPKENFFGKDEFSIIVTDDDNHEIELPVSIEIENRDDPSTISVNRTDNAKEDTPFKGRISISDVEGLSRQEFISIKPENGPKHGSVIFKNVPKRNIQDIDTASPGRSKYQYRNHHAFAALTSDGEVVAWGNNQKGGDLGQAKSDLKTGVVKIVSSDSSFAAIKEDGSVITWGDQNSGGNSSDIEDKLKSGVSDIASTYGAFAAIKLDGSVVTWGTGHVGGNSENVKEDLESGVIEIVSAKNAFAALKADGSVVAWGHSGLGGYISGVKKAQLESGVTKIFSNPNAFAAVKDDGSVITWGSHNEGGNSHLVKDKLKCRC